MMMQAHFDRHDLQRAFDECKRRSKNPSLKRSNRSAAPE